MTTRREFLKFLSGNFAAGLLLTKSPNWFRDLSSTSDSGTFRIPDQIRRYLALVTPIEIGKDGYGRLLPDVPGIENRLPVLLSQWNNEHKQSWDRLANQHPWGIVLHWFGDLKEYNLSLAGFLRGFDGLRKISEYITRTSAHFLVGEIRPNLYFSMQDRPGIVQIQKPDLDGTPFVASHLQPLDYQSNVDRTQYFLKALDLLEQDEPGCHSLLQDFFYGVHDDPNMRTFAIEISGVDFDNKMNFPPDQQIANVLAIVWAIMKRYHIPINNVMGHCELDLTKADPGKKFMALIRLLIGIKALIDHDDVMLDLVFGRFGIEENKSQAVVRYFSFIRNYLLMTSTPAHVFEWELVTGYWQIIDWIQQSVSAPIADTFSSPIKGNVIWPMHKFLEPVCHEGVDLFPRDSRKQVKSTPIHLVANGTCLYSGTSFGMCSGLTMIFQHGLPNGAQILTIYSHLNEINSVQMGEKIQIGTPIAKVFGNPQYPEFFLHYAMAYGSTWETDLRFRPYVPMDAGFRWITDRFFEPTKFLQSEVQDTISLRNSGILPR